MIAVADCCMKADSGNGRQLGKATQNFFESILAVTRPSVCHFPVEFIFFFFEERCLRCGMNERMFSFCLAQVTDHATTALLHYQLPQMPDVVVRSFMVSKFEDNSLPPDRFEHAGSKWHEAVEMQL